MVQESTTHSRWTLKTNDELRLSSLAALPVSQVANGDAPDQEANVESGLVHVHQPAIWTHQVKLEQTHNVDNNVNLSLTVQDLLYIGLSQL